METWTIAKNTYGKVMRIKSVYLLMALCIALMSMGIFYDILTLHEDARLTVNASLSIITGIAILIAVFIGSREVTQEIESRTLDTLLAKPIGRDHFIVGKFFGTFMIAATFAAVLGVGMVLVLAANGKAIPPSVFSAVYFVILEVLVLSAVSVLFSIVFPEFIGLVFSMIVVGVGHLLYTIPVLAAASKAKVLLAIYYLLPNLDFFNLKNEVASGASIPGKLVGIVTIYAVIYTIFVVVLAASVFRRKDIN